MDTVEEHPHSFSAAGWPFQGPSNTAAFTTVRVIREGYPILLVVHDHDGDWQFLCGTTSDAADGRIICLGCAFDQDRSIGDLADLPLGWEAWRENVDAPWQRTPFEAEED